MVSEICWGLKIAAFNIQNFGYTKMSNSEVVEILAQVQCKNIFLKIVYSKRVYNIFIDCETI